jgi:hypothetical protein
VPSYVFTPAQLGIYGIEELKVLERKLLFGVRKERKEK